MHSRKRHRHLFLQKYLTHEADRLMIDAAEFERVSTAIGQTTTDCINALTLVNSIDLVQWFWKETMRVYDVMWRDSDEQANDELIEMIRRKGGTITVRELMRGRRRYRSVELATDALQELVISNRGEWVHPPSTIAGGKPMGIFNLFD